jgi:hypothetical protein
MTKRMAQNLLFLTAVICCGSICLFVGCEKGKKADAEKTRYEIDKVYERGPLTVHIRVNKGKISIADTVLLEIESAMKPGYKLQMPKVDKVLENFGIIDWHSTGDRLDEQNNIVSKFQYRLEPFLSGKFPIPAFKFEFADANSVQGKKYELDTEPIDIEVTSLLAEQREKLVIADIEDVVEIPRKISYWWIFGVLTGVVIASAGGWVYLRRKRAEELIRIFKPAHKIAYDRLRELVKQDLIKQRKIKEFYERISDILRHYIEHRFNLRAPERTTEEFLAEIQFTEVLSSADKNRLAEFLEHCDMVKFAKYNPTAEQVQRTFDLVKDFIEKTKSDERQIDVTNNVNRERVEAGKT